METDLYHGGEATGGTEHSLSRARVKVGRPRQRLKDGHRALSVVWMVKPSSKVAARTVRKNGNPNVADSEGRRVDTSTKRFDWLALPWFADRRLRRTDRNYSGPAFVQGQSILDASLDPTASACVDEIRQGVQCQNPISLMY